MDSVLTSVVLRMKLILSSLLTVYVLITLILFRFNWTACTSYEVGTPQSSTKFCEKTPLLL